MPETTNSNKKESRQAESRQQKIRRIFNAFDPSKPELLAELYAESAVFQDPVTKVTGREKIRGYYSKAYRQVKEIKFEFGEMSESGDTIWAPWQMRLVVANLNGGKPFSVEGVSLLQFDSKDQLVFHRDYLDLGQMVYEKIPIFGKIIRTFKAMLDHQS